MTDVHALSGAYAVDALDDLERARFERHLTDCADCRHEVASLREAAALLADTVALEPPPSLRAKVLADIATVRPLAPVIAEPAATTGHRPRWQGLLAVAAAVTVLGSGVAIVQPWESETTQQQPQLTAVEQVMRAKDAKRIVQPFKDGSQATVVISEELRMAVVVAEGMEPPPPGKVYQLWYQQPSGTLVSAGLMPRDPYASVLLHGDAARAEAVGITLEPEGGSPTGEPTLPPVALFAIEA